MIFLSGLGMSLLTLADQQLVSSYLGLSANAIYTTAIFMVMIIELPYRFVSEISAPILSMPLQKRILMKSIITIKKHPSIFF